MEALRLWREEKARQLNLHVGVVFPANVLENLSVAPPADIEGLAGIPGMRRWRVREFGAEILDLFRNGQTPPEPPSN